MSVESGFRAEGAGTTLAAAPEAAVGTHHAPGVPQQVECLLAVVEAVPDGILTIDADGSIESINTTAASMFGYTADLLIGRNLSVLLPEAQRSGEDGYISRFLAETAQRVKGHAREVIGLQKDGSAFPFEIALSETKVSGRRLFVGIVRDISERRAAEDRATRLQELLDLSSDAIESLSLDGRIIAWNAGAERLYGYSAADAAQMNIRNLLPRERAGEFEDVVARLQRGEAVAPYETQRIADDGAIVEILCTMTLLRGRGGTSDCVYVTDRDISEHKLNNVALRTSEAQMRAVVEAAVDGIISINEHGVIQSVNPAVERMFGYEAVELLGASVTILMPPASAAQHAGYVRRFARTGVRRSVDSGREVIGRRKNGSTFPAELAISEMVIEGGRMFTGVLRDISERKRIEQALLDQSSVIYDNNRALMELNLRAEEATAAKSQFLANMSHEIRTPMTAILGYAEQLQLGQLGEDEQRQAIDTIQRNGQHLLQLINDILDLSKIEAGRLEMERIRCSPAAILYDVAALMRVRVNDAKLRLSIEFDGPIPDEIESDPTRLKQILVNLVGNAIKFTERGEVRIVSRFMGEGSQASLTFDVIDTGIGMTTEQIQRLFRPFSQADGSMTRKYGGTGLGLTISQRMAGMLGGGIEVDSELGRGSRFSLRIAAPLPPGAQLVTDPRAEVRPAAPTAEPLRTDVLAGVRVLLAEDGPDNQRLVTSILRRAGAEVQVAQTGAEALDLEAAARLAGTPFQVILMDMQMPVMDGYEAAAALRKRQYDGRVIAFTAHAMSDDRDRCISAGCHDYVTKPVSRADIIAAVARNAPVEKPAGGIE